MKPSRMAFGKDKILLFDYASLAVLSAGIFFLDLLAPLGVAVWSLYLLPLGLTFRLPGERTPFYFCILVAALSLAGLLFSSPGAWRLYDAVNRILGLLAMWGFAFLVARYKRSQAALFSAKAGHALATAQLQEVSQDKAQALDARRRAEEEALAARIRLEAIVHSAMDAIITVNEAQQIVLFNRAAESMFQCKAEDALGQSLDRFIPERFRGRHRDHIKAFGKSGVTSRRMGSLGVITALRGNGEEFPAEAAISQVGIDGGAFYTVIMRDITERTRVEQSLRQSEQRYRQLVEVSPDAIFINRGDRIVFINREGLELLGATSPDQILGRSPLDFVHPESHQQVKDRTRQLLEGLDQVPLVEEKFLRLDGSVVDVEVTAARYMDQDEPAIQVVLRDITQRKRLQDQLRRTERVAELGTLASGMAHEIGTPMNVILGRAEYLMNRTNDEPIKKGLQTIVGQVERITRVMNQLLSFARRRAPERRAVDLKQIVEANLEMFHERLARHQIEVDMDFEETCPPVHADADQMSQVLINLLMNALHAMPEGGRVRIAARCSERDMVEWTIEDTGSGIPPDVVAKIFDPFFTTKEFGAGTGLGLTVVKGIMEEHGGSISVESELGKGTTFKMLLPRSGRGAHS